MMLELRKKLAFLYPTYVLAIVSIGYVLGELGHYLIGVTSKAIATDLHYGKTYLHVNIFTYTEIFQETSLVNSIIANCI